MAEQGTDITGFAVEITTDLIAELRERFPAFSELAKRDRDAIVSAVGKGVWRGILRGTAVYGHALNEIVEVRRAEDPDFPDIQVETHLDISGPREPDLWAEAHGS